MLKEYRSNFDVEGHFAAVITIIIWGTTFISTKILLNDFSPIEILLMRFVLGLMILIAVYPKFMYFDSAKREIVFALAGFTGICAYYLLENVALIYTLAANVGVIISAAPLFTAILAKLILKENRLTKKFMLGFTIAMSGICCISFGGHDEFSFNMWGDCLSLLAAFVWALYSILTKKISEYGYNPIQAVRKMFFYGLLFMLPLYFSSYTVESFDAVRLLEPVNLANMLFLGAGASALCFVTWNVAVEKLGAVKTSLYIYAVPAITVITAVMVLDEEVTEKVVIGTVLTITGLILSQHSR